MSIAIETLGHVLFFLGVFIVLPACVRVSERQGRFWGISLPQKVLAALAVFGAVIMALGALLAKPFW